MTSESGLNFTSKDKVLLHLKGYWQHRQDKEFPVALTQKGISEMTGVRLSHVPRTIKRMLSRELVNEVKAHVQGESRRYKVYCLTEKGMLEANHLLDSVKDRRVVVDGVEGSVGELLEAEDDAYKLRLLMRLAGEDISSLKKRPVVVGPVPDVSDFVNREEERTHLTGMLSDPISKIMIIYGSQGYGTSALAASFTSEVASKWSVCWIEIKKNLNEMTAALVEALERLDPETAGDPIKAGNPEKLAGILDGKKIILVCDGYFDVSDEVVEFFNGLVSAIRNTDDFKILVTAREDTPSYNRFYTILDIHDGVVGEVHIRGLDQEHCKVVLDTPDIEPDALKRLFLFTRGCPTTLKLLASENVDELKSKTRFSPEEIKLMLFLKSRTKN
jgi:DNA-binding MarR family transcriptional regulator